MISKVVQLMRVGDWFAWDSKGIVGGDVFFCEVIEIIARFDAGIDRVGESGRGYKVRTFSSVSNETVVDYYALDYVDEQCVRLTREQAERARRAGWPHTRRWLRELRRRPTK